MNSERNLLANYVGLYGNASKTESIGFNKKNYKENVSVQLHIFSRIICIPRSHEKVYWKACENSPGLKWIFSGNIIYQATSGWDSFLIYLVTTWTLTKTIDSKLHATYTPILRAILNISRRQLPKKITALWTHRWHFTVLLEHRMCLQDSASEQKKKK